MEKKKQHFFL